MPNSNLRGLQRKIRKSRRPLFYGLAFTLCLFAAGCFLFVHLQKELSLIPAWVITLLALSYFAIKFTPEALEGMIPVEYRSEALHQKLRPKMKALAYSGFILLVASIAIPLVYRAPDLRIMSFLGGLLIFLSARLAHYRMKRGQIAVVANDLFLLGPGGNLKFRAHLTQLEIAFVQISQDPDTGQSFAEYRASALHHRSAMHLMVPTLKQTLFEEKIALGRANAPSVQARTTSSARPRDNDLSP